MIDSSFTNWERNGFVLLIIIIIAGFTANYFISSYVENTEPDFDISDISKDINKFETNLYKQTYSKQSKENKQTQIRKNKYAKIQSRKIKYYKFDPNKATLNDWLKFGFSEKQAKAIVKFIKSGNGIKKTSDLRNIYVISEQKFKALKPYIVIEKKQQNNGKHKTKTTQNNIKIELNSAEAKTLVKIKGIGEKTANRIIKYRKLLGGYVSVVQLNEVYGISEENYNKMKNGLRIDRTKIKKISLNFSNKKELAKHPYISFEQAGAVIDYRSKNGAYVSVNQVFDLGLLKNDLLKYYLTLN
jgi:DNA uptake protein ComE-like DNA-binding protein